MELDCNALDRELRDAWTRWRAALAGLRQDAVDVQPSPFARWPRSRLTDVLAELADRAAEPHAMALHGWLQVVAAEHDLWPQRVELGRCWSAPVFGVEPGEAEMSLRELRRRMLRSSHGADRAGYASAFAARATELAELARRDVELRRARARNEWPSAAEGGGAVAQAVRVASLLLSATEPLAHDLPAGRWWDGLHDALGRSADQGWPARLNARWTREVLRAVDDPATPTHGFIAPPAWGALSFAQALGGLGVAWLETARARAPHFATHSRPLGVRRFQRFGLLASLVLEPSFVSRELELGRERASIHLRRVARALVRSLRIDAMRVLLFEALGEGSGEAAEERYQQLGARVLGEAPPSSLNGVVPQVGPAVGPSLLGRVLAVAERGVMMERFGEDWYRNPRCGRFFRECDAKAEDIATTPDEVLNAAVADLGQLLESLG